MDGSSLQMSHGGPKLSMAWQLSRAYVFERKSMRRHNVGMFIRVASTLSHTLCVLETLQFGLFRRRVLVDLRHARLFLSGTDQSHGGSG